MKTKFSGLTIVFFFCISLAHSQTLSFCERVNADGSAVNSYSSYTIEKNGSPVTFLFTVPTNATTQNVNFDVYRVMNGKEVYQSTVKQAASQKNWITKQMTFYQEGQYVIYVFDEKDKNLAKATLTVKKADK